MRSPGILLAFALLSGIFLASFVRIPPAISLPLAAALLAASLAFGYGRSLRFAPPLVVLGYFLLGAAAEGVMRETWAHGSLRSTFHRLGGGSLEAPSRIEGRLRREPELEPEFAILTLDSDFLRSGGKTHPVRGGVRARVGGELRSRLTLLTASDRIALWGRLNEPSFFRNEGGFDGESWLERERLDLFASVKSALLVERLRSGSGSAAWISRVRRSANERLASALEGPKDSSSETTIGVVIALVTGERARLSPEIEKLYREAGIFHVMAISGAQVAVVALVFYHLLRRLGAGEVATLWTLLSILPVYASFCGSGPPVVRAAVAACIVVGARLLSLDRPQGNALALAALLLLVWQPAWLEDPGFQLSFAAMAAILWLTEPLSHRLRFLGPLAKPLAVSLAAQSVVVPITAWHFHGFTWVAPLTSLLAVPLSGAIVIAGLVLVPFAGVPLLGDVLVFAAHLGVRLLTGTAEIASRLPAASVAIARPSLLWVSAYYAALALIRHGPPRMRAPALGGMALLVAALVAGPLSPGERGRFELTAVDVGHGDALVLTLPEGKRILIDGGGLPASSFDVGERVLLPYLLDNGGRRLDAVVVTHADFDHLGGLLAVVESMRVGEVWEGAPRWERPLYRRFRTSVRRRGIPRRTLRAGESFAFGGALWEVLAAGQVSKDGRRPESENERSVVMRISVGASRLLLTGDAGEETESDLLRRGVPLRAQVLKLGHHGSRGSTTEEFLAAVAPRFAVVSGRRSAARPLPAPEVLERLRTFGVDYARTDEEGAITVRLDGKGGFEVETFVGRRRDRGKERKVAKAQ